MGRSFNRFLYVAGKGEGEVAKSEQQTGETPSLVGIFRMVGRLLRGERRLHWLLLLILALLSSGVEALAAAMIFVLLGMVTGSDAIVLPVLGDVSRWFAAADTQLMFIGVSAAIGTFFVLRAVLLITQCYVQHRLSLHAGVRLSRRLFAGYLTMPYQFHLHRNSSELIRNCHDSISMLTRDVLQPGTRLVSETLITLGVIGVLLWTAPVASVLAVILLGVTAIVLLRLVHPKIDRFGSVSQAMVSKTFKVLQQSLGGIREIAVLGCAQEFVRPYVQTRGELARSNYWHSTLSEIPRAVLEAVLVLFIIAFFLFALAAEGTPLDVVPVLGVFAYAGLRLKPSMTVIVRALNSIRFAGPAIAQLESELEGIGKAADLADVGSGSSSFEQFLSIEDVSFTYEGADVPALERISLCIARGDAVGIVGPTGAGKTTLLDLLLGLLAPTDGQITVDGVDIHDDLAGWRRNLGVVPQSVFLIDDTLRRNIAFGVAEDEVEEAALRRALTLAQLDSFVEGLPAGLDTEIGERGVRVSGGQRQRIAIARALYREPSVLVFDEGTSALDNQTEAEFMDALRRLRGTRTIIMVAHRLSTVRDCDQVVVIEGGRVAGVGTYEQLLAESPTFRQLARRVG